MATARSHVRTQMTWLAMMDLTCLFVAGVLGVTLRLGPEEITQYVFNHLEGWMLLFGGILLANYLAGSYRVQYTYSRFNLVVTWLFSLIFALFILSITSYAWMQDVMGRGVLLLTLAAFSVFSLSLKLLLYRYLFRSEIFLCRTAILGAGPRARELRRILEHELVLPAHRVVAFIEVLPDGIRPVDSEHLLDEVVVLRCTSGELEGLVRSLGISLIVLGFDDIRLSRPLYACLTRLRFEGVEVLGPLSVYEIYRGTTPVELVNEEILMQASLESGLPIMRRVKRLMDLVVSSLGLILLLPVGLVVALLLKLSAPGSPVFYTQARVGQFGRPFTIYKFRTMRPDAEAVSGAVWAAIDDVRITGIGRILRRYRLDEIPQFINILAGEMSLVGPRPERPEMTLQLQQVIPFYGERENVPPGLTGWAQIRYPYGATVEDARHKLEFDLYYIKHLSISLDLQILLSTLRIVTLGKERET